MHVVLKGLYGGSRVYIMEKKMETTRVVGVIWGLYRDYRVYIGVILR